MHTPWRSVVARNALAALDNLVPFYLAEAIVDIALALSKPFAVVPCCVFPFQFPDRRLDGKPVETFDDFVRYLCKKDERIQLQKLGFEGRSLVLFMAP
jgi:hypothetical protein